jgi:3-dehydroquinate synthase class II
VKRIHALGNEYDQDAVLVKDADKIKLVFNDGHEIEVGNLSAGGLGTMYTKLRNNKKTNTFIFTEERDEVGFIARLAGIKR